MRKEKTMQLPENFRQVPLQCYVNGHLKILTAQEAYVLSWRVTFAWLFPLDWFRSATKQGYMRDLLTKAPKLLACSLFTRGYLALTINDPCVLDGDNFAPSRSTFQARACRLAKIFDGKPPFVFDECLLGKRELVPCYRMIPDQEWLIIVREDAESEFTGPDIDWRIFQIDPKEQSKPGASKE